MPTGLDRQAKAIVVIGSLNMDLVMRTPRVPEGGETLVGHDFHTVPGGKGANQAVACARLGGNVRMIGRVGKDEFGKTLLEGLASAGIDASGILQTDDSGTGVAMILVEDSGQNRILLAAGANGVLAIADIERMSPWIKAASMLIVQLEVPLEVVQHAVQIARGAGVPILLNPAPAAALTDAFLAWIDILVPNETEASVLVGFPVSDIDSAKSAAQRLRQRGASRVVVTLGDRGVVAADDAGVRHYPAHTVEAQDTTAAGDTFIGGLSVALTEGASLDAAIALGQKASALCVGRLGAQPSIPCRSELDC